MDSEFSILAGIVNIFSIVANFISGKPYLSPEERVSNILVLFGMGRDVNNECKLIFE